MRVESRVLQLANPDPDLGEKVLAIAHCENDLGILFRLAGLHEIQGLLRLAIRAAQRPIGRRYGFQNILACRQLSPAHIELEGDGEFSSMRLILAEPDRTQSQDQTANGDAEQRSISLLRGTSPVFLIA